LILVGQAAPDNRVDALRSAGAEVVTCEAVAGRVDPAAALDELRRRGAIRVLLEGGGELAGAFFEWKLVDRVLAFVAPKLIGGRLSPSPLGGPGLDPMARAVALWQVETRLIGKDLLVEGIPVWEA
jgi:diaminohydroxyphosphoribosylaminopyrimidine deaminase/5-amino-6-(5-phosphoribosylamino)uracil reductase